MFKGHSPVVKTSHDVETISLLMNTAIKKKNNPSSIHSNQSLQLHSSLYSPAKRLHDTTGYSQTAEWSHIWSDRSPTESKRWDGYVITTAKAVEIKWITLTKAAPDPHFFCKDFWLKCIPSTLWADLHHLQLLDTNPSQPTLQPATL